MAQLLLGAGADLEAEDNGGPCDCLEMEGYLFMIYDLSYDVYTISYHNLIYVIALNILEIWHFLRLD